MRLFAILIAALLFIPAAAFAESPAYDAELAADLGADDYGMRSYVFVMLRTGPTEVDEGEERDALFAGHFANMGMMAEAGNLVLAGPFSSDGDERGLFILNVSTINEAKGLVENDPAVAAGVLKADYLNFYGSAALMKINDIHSKIQKEQM